MDTCLIIAKDHEVISYKFNGHKRFIVERVNPISRHDIEVSNFKRHYGLGNKWEKVYNHIDKVYNFNMHPTMEKAIDRLTF